MGKLYCLIILLFLGSSSYSQSVKKDTSAQFMIIDSKPVNPKDKPLYVVDGIITKRGIKNIKPDDIESISILKPPASTNIYGKSGINGVILITTKRKENVNLNKANDTLVEIYSPIRDMRSKFPDHPLYVVDEITVEDSLAAITINKIDPRDIFEMTILRDAQAQALYGVRGALDVIMIKTESGVMEEYQKKFSSFSDKYKKYLIVNKNKDDDIGYIVNGIFITGQDKRDKISKLYKVSKMDIKSLDLMDNTFQNGNKEKKIVVITTKK